jgi:hypothetical protein
MRRLAMLAFLICLLMLWAIAGIDPAVAQIIPIIPRNPTITLSQSAGFTGISVNVIGSNFPASYLGEVLWNDSPMDPRVTFRSNEASFSIPITIPRDAEGQHSISVVFSVSAGQTQTATTNFILVGGNRLTEATGAVGLPGMTGDAGPTGPPGLQGEPGIQGPSGKTGGQGIQGPTGIAGPQGAPGPVGPAGHTGTTRIVQALVMVSFFVALASFILALLVTLKKIALE